MKARARTATTATIPVHIALRRLTTRRMPRRRRRPAAPAPGGAAGGGGASPGGAGVGCAGCSSCAPVGPACPWSAGGGRRLRVCGRRCVCRRRLLVVLLVLHCLSVQCRRGESAAEKENCSGKRP